MHMILKAAAAAAVCCAVAHGVAEEVSIYPTRGHLVRAFSRMEASTAEKPATIRILFYGQSIVGQNVWCQQIVSEWRKRYPTVKFVVKNLAIGGYGTDSLVHCIESDIFPFYPDVLFFHDYGDVEGGYGYMLGEVRKRTTAEIVIWSSHLRYDEPPQAIMDARAMPQVPKLGKRTAEMRGVADYLDLVFVDLQGNWCKLLFEQKWKPTVLLADSVHLNNKGFSHYSRFLLENLVPGPAGSDGNGGASGTITRVPFAKGAKTQPNGDIVFEFDGNRVTAVSSGLGYADPSLGKAVPAGEVLVDGVPVRDIPSQWIHTRSSAINNWFPGCDTPVRGKTKLLDETWTLRINSFASKGKKKYVTYSVTGSKTGFDGEGSSTNLFVSNSGRVVIPGPWLGSTCNPWKSRGPVPGISKCVWKSVLLPVDVYSPQEKGVETVLATGLSNGRHVLTIRNPHGDLGIAEFVVSKPNPKWDRAPNEREAAFLKRMSKAQFIYGDSEWH